VSERVFAPDPEATPVVEPVDAPGGPWQPRRGAPPARPGETRTEYGRRLKRERNRRHHARKRREAEAGTPAAKIAAAALRPPRREHRPSVAAGGERTPPRAETLSYQQWLEAVRMPEPPRSLLVTAIGQRSFDPLDSEEIEDCLRWLDGQAEVVGIPADTIRAALASVLPGEPLSLLVEEPKPA
jgi:hypothetical protein